MPSGSPIITGNTIDLNGTGISASGGPFSPTITGNTINANTSYGISLTATGGGSATILSNNIYCNTAADLFASLFPSIDVSSNAWDHDAGTIPTGPTTAVSACPPGTDICGSATFTTFNPAVVGGCL